jgi:HrpA-like RNA helicase
MDQENDKKITEYIKIANNYQFNNNFLNDDEIKYFKKPIGLFDPLGNNINPLTGLEYKNLYSDQEILLKSGPLANNLVKKTYKNFAYIWTNLKVYEFSSTIIDSINNNQITLIVAGTGVGKTVLTPNLVLQAFNFKKKIICTVPKQILASNSAKTASECLDVVLGEQVGYFYMGSKHVSDKTLLTFTTPGSLKSLLTNDPYLQDYNCLIIDEIHERSIQTDQLLYLTREILKKRNDFKLVLMSATIDLSIFRNYFNNFKYNEIEILGKSFNVDIIYENKPVSDWKKLTIIKCIDILKTTKTGDILVFIKSGSDGRLLCNLLHQECKKLNFNPYCSILEGRSKQDDRDYSISEFKYKTHPDMDLNNPYDRKIVMATNVAESSLTVDGIIYVIDCGFSLESWFFPLENASSLLEHRISKAAAIQRAGRAGRTCNGTCYRLYTEKEYLEFNDFPIPDIQKTDLTNDILDIFLLEYIKNVNDVKHLLNNLISKPSDYFINCALFKLSLLKLITKMKDNGEITPLGKVISKFRSIDVNFAISILASYYYKCAHDVINIILISIELDGRIEYLFDKPKHKNDENEFLSKIKKFYNKNGDYLTILDVYTQFKKESDQKKWCKKNFINSNIFMSGGKDKIKIKSKKIFNILLNIIRFLDSEKINYFSFNDLGSHESNILLSLSFGITNIATLSDSNKLIYKTNNTLTSSNCKCDPKTTLDLKKKPKYVLYNELFIFKKNQPILKLNMVTKISSNIMKVITKYYK